MYFTIPKFIRNITLLQQHYYLNNNKIKQTTAIQNNAASDIINNRVKERLFNDCEFSLSMEGWPASHCTESWPLFYKEKLYSSYLILNIERWLVSWHKIIFLPLASMRQTADRGVKPYRSFSSSGPAVRNCLSAPIRGLSLTLVQFKWCLKQHCFCTAYERRLCTDYLYLYTVA